MLSARQLGMMHRVIKPSETIHVSTKEKLPTRVNSSLGADWLSDSTIEITRSLLRFSDFSQCRWCLAGYSCMYGLSDKCPASVDTLSSLLDLISPLDFGSERVHEAVRCFVFQRITYCDVINPLGGAFNLAVKIVKVVILKAWFWMQAKLWHHLRHTTFHVGIYYYKLLISSIKRPKSPMPLKCHLKTCECFKMSPYNPWMVFNVNSYFLYKPW